jgi:hypothetical protein
MRHRVAVEQNLMWEDLSSPGNEKLEEEKQPGTVEVNKLFENVDNDDVPVSKTGDKHARTNEAQNQRQEDRRVADWPHDPLAGFEPIGQPQAQPQDPDVPLPQEGTRRSMCLRMPTRYIRDILAGEGSATGEEGKPVLPVGLQLPRAQDADATIALAAINRSETDDHLSVEMEGEFKTELEFALAVGLNPTTIVDPTSLAEARKLEDWLLWEEVIRKEMDQMEKMGVWEETNVPKDAHIIGSKFVLHYKTDVEGKIASRKARLVALGNTQIEGINFRETFAPTAKLTAVRIVAALATRNDWPLEQLDVDGAYLNAPLSETIYMRLPKGFEEPGKEESIRKLCKALYGLRQGSREWYEHLCTIMSQLGFTMCRVENAVFYRHKDGNFLVIAVNTDDMLMAGSVRKAIEEFKGELSARVKIKDLGDVHWLLGIEVARNCEMREVSFSQKAYVQKILERFGMTDAKPLTTPMDPNVKLSIAQCPSTAREITDMKNVSYREAIGSLMYAALGTRPDIMFSVSFLLQFMQNPGRAHWEAVKRVMRYLKGTMDIRLVIGGKGEWYWAGDGYKVRNGLEGFTDADGATQWHRHAISGYVFTINSRAVSWSSKKQAIVTLSTMEAEYITATHAAKEALLI